jgi:hypothetical protein
MHDSHQQLIGQIALVNIDGLKLRQASIFQELVESHRPEISLGDLHVASVAHRDFASFHRSVAAAIVRRGLMPLDAVALGARLHLAGLQTLAHLRQLSQFGGSILTQLADGLVDDNSARLAQSRLRLS